MRIFFFLKRCEKGKPVVRRGRKATGLRGEEAGLPNRGRELVGAPQRKEVAASIRHIIRFLGSSGCGEGKEGQWLNIET